MLIKHYLIELIIFLLINIIQNETIRDKIGLPVKEDGNISSLKRIPSKTYRIIVPIRQEITQIELNSPRTTTAKKFTKTTTKFLLENEILGELEDEEDIKHQKLNENLYQNTEQIILNSTQNFTISLLNETKNNFIITTEKLIENKSITTFIPDQILNQTFEPINQDDISLEEDLNTNSEETILKTFQDLPKAIRLREQYAGGFNCHTKWYPYFAYILRLSGSYCAGTLISHRYVLTAGHCCYGYQIKGVFAGYYYDRNTWDQYLEPENVIVHGQYDNDTFQYDACIIKVEGFEKTQAIKYITLNPKFTPNSNLFSVGYATNTSTKSSSFYHLGSMPCIENIILSEEDCKRKMLQNKINIELYDPKTMICTEPSFKRTDQIIEADCGGPLIMSNQQIGISSFVLATKNGTGLSFHTQIDAIFPFISTYLSHELKERSYENGNESFTFKNHQKFTLFIYFLIFIVM